MENYQVADADTPLPTLVGPGNFCVAIRNPAVAADIADELNRLAAEAERLREALRRICVRYAAAYDSLPATEMPFEFYAASCIASQALQPLPAPPKEEE